MAKPETPERKATATARESFIFYVLVLRIVECRTYLVDNVIVFQSRF